ncbi:MAG TPA: CinA family protein, partial [Phenylobacterium sp.]|nr:CinA family protein [Phenylobacterium sp.]
TGVAGPGGGTPLKPVGTVHLATARSNEGIMHKEEFFEDDTREGVQLAAVQSALQMLRDRLA